MAETTQRVFIVVGSWSNYNDEYTENGIDTIKAFRRRDQAEEFLARCKVRARVSSDQSGGTYGQDLRIVEMEVPVTQIGGSETAPGETPGTSSAPGSHG